MTERKIIEESGGFGMPVLIQEGGWLFGGSVTEASMWLDGNGDIHIQRTGECSEFVEEQIAETVAHLQTIPRDYAVYASPHGTVVIHPDAL